jgi:hypothetical protein
LTSLGNWGSAKVVGTQLTLIPRWFEFTATYIDTGEVVIDGERESKPNAQVDDVCSWTEEFYLEGDPYFPDGWYRIDSAVGARVVGRG